MKRMMVVAVVVSMLLGSLVYGQEKKNPVDARSKVKTVTVYPDRALVTRSAEIELKRGINEVALRDLPIGIVDETVRAKATGGEAVRLVGTEVKSYHIRKVEEEKIKELLEKREKLLADVKVIDDEIFALGAEREFILSLKVGVGKEISEKITKEKPSIADWKELATFIKDSLGENTKKVREKERQKKDILDELRVIEGELSKLQGGQTLEKKSIIVSLEARQDIKIRVEASYIIFNASWVPSYDAHAEGEGGSEKVQLKYYGEVRQNTGEDWNEVELYLSTAQPAISAQMPEISPQIISSRPKQPYAPGRAKYDYEEEEAGGFGRAQRGFDDKTRSLNEMTKKEMLAEARPMFAIVQEGAASHIFKIPKPETIPSDGEPHRTTIDIQEFRVGFEYVTTPKLSQYAYLKTEIENTDKYPLLPGKLNVFLKNEFVGTSALKLVAPKQKFEVFLGIDANIKVERKLEEKKEEAGALRKLNYTYSIKVENFKDKKVKVTIIDQVPVSQESDIEVMLEGDIKPDKEGKITWVKEIPAGKSETIILKYKVYYPAGRPVHGLE
jgi:uncharacterized protein (TIGR02231 family)